MAGKTKVRQGFGKGAAKGEAEQEGDGDDLFVEAIAAVRGPAHTLHS